MIPLYDPRPEIRRHRAEFDRAIGEVLDSGGFVLGEHVERFEHDAAAYVGVGHAVGVNSGTDALVIALRAAGIGPGDEVVTSPFTFFATGEAVDAVGARPVFADIDPETMNLDPVAVVRALTERTRAIVPVHLFGRPADVGALVEIADHHGLVVVEDAAQAFGAAAEGRRVGSLGTAAAFSFFPSKNLGGFGDGGLIATDDGDLAEQARRLRNHGSIERYRNTEFGYNSRLDGLQAAVLSTKLRRLDQANEERRAIATAYNEAFGGLDGVIVPGMPERDRHVFHQYTLRLVGHDRRLVQEQLAAAGVGTAVYYPTPLHRLPVYAGRSHGPLPVTDRLAGEVLSLPIFPGLTDRQRDTVIRELTSAVAGVSVGRRG